MALPETRSARWLACAALLLGAVHSWPRDEARAAEQPRDGKGITAVPLSKIDQCLKSGDWGLRRRALWVLAQTHRDPGPAVDRMLAVDQVEGGSRTPIYPVLQLLGKAALPRLYEHLRTETVDQQRLEVFAAITLLGEPDAAARRALEELSKHTRNDEDLAQLVLILRAGASAPKEAEALLKEAALDRPRSTLRFMGGEGAFWPLMAYESTRTAALEDARRRLVAGLAKLKRREDLDYYLEVCHPLHAMLIAARTGALTAADVPLLEKAHAETSGQPDHVPFLMAKWLASGRKDPKMLEAMLQAADPRHPVGHTVFGMHQFMGNEMLRDGDLAALTARAVDEKSDEGVRLGAIFLLRLAGAPHREAREAILRLAESGTDVVALHAAFAIQCVLEPLDEKTRLVRQVRSLLDKEKRAPVREALEKSLKVLEAL